MANYLKMAVKQQIQALLALGWSYRRIERETGVRRETISRYDREGISKPAKVPAGSELRLSSNSRAAPHHDVIQSGLDKGLSAQRIFEDLCFDHGYGGSYDSVKRYCRRLKKIHRQVVGVMHSAPGEEAQVDFFAGAPTLDPVTGRYRKTWIFQMTLCCSRHSFEEAVFEQKIEPFIRCHEHAFRFFGGVPRVVRLDNLKAGVVRACLYDPDVADVYAAFARHWGFAPLPCQPRNPKEKGKVERSGGYMKGSLKGRTFESLSEQNAFLARRNRTISSLRIHGTTKRQVIAHFLEVEKPTLLPLADEQFSLFETGRRTVHPDGHIQVKGAFYSVPHHLVGCQLTVRYDDRLVKVFDGETMVAAHLRVVAGTFATADVHRPASKPARQESYVRALFAKAERIGPGALAWARAAEKERDVRAYRLIQGMLSLTRRHPKERVNWACKVAEGAGQYRYRTLVRLVEQANKEAPAAKPQLIQAHEIIRPLSSYQQEAGT